MYSNTVNRLRAYVFLLLASLPALVFAQSTVNLTLDDASMDEEFLGTGGFTVTRDGSTAAGINVFVEYTGSATINTDFTTTNLVGYIPPVWYIHIPAGQNSTSVVLTPRKDNSSEGIETLAFTLQPSVPNNGDYTVGTQVLAEMTLADDVAEVILTLDDADMDEANQGTGGFTVTRDDHGDLSAGINVFVEYTGSATINTDFTTTNLVGYIPPVWYIHIPAGQNSTSVVLTPIKDFVIEGDETLAFTLQESVPNNGDYNVGAQTTAEMMILDLVDKIFLDGFEDPLIVLSGF